MILDKPGISGRWRLEDQLISEMFPCASGK